MISFYVLSKRLVLNRKGLFDARVVSISKKENGFADQWFFKIHKVSKVNIW